MDIKFYFFCICISQTVYMGQCISKSSIVRFRCSSCKPRQDDCCFGTLILPFVILTTSYCGDICQSVELSGKKVPIINVFTHPHYKNFIQGYIPYVRNDISLVHIKLDSKNERPYVKLSSIETYSATGLKAHVPILDGLKPRLLVTVIQHCANDMLNSKGFYVCAVNKILPKLPKKCHQQQGMPLLVKGKIIGITGIADSGMCKFPQKVFTAVGPALSWIKSTVDYIRTLGDEKTPIWRESTTTRTTTTTTRPSTTDTITIKSTIATTTTPSITTTTTSAPTTSTTTPTTTTPETTESISTPVTVAEKYENFTNDKQTEVTIENTLGNFQFKLRAKMMESLTTKFLTIPTMPYWFKVSREPLEDDMWKLMSQYKNKENLIVRHQLTTTERTTMITSPATITVTTTTTRKTYPTTTTAQEDSTTLKNELESNEISNNITKESDPVKLATNAMDWFNKNVRNKLKDQPKPVLVLTTMAEQILTTPFVDLT